MIRIIGRHQIFLMTVEAVGSGLSKTIGSMTLRTIKGTVYACQPVSRGFHMAPLTGFDIFPGKSVMAVFTMRTQPQLIAVILPPFPMAGFTGFWGPLKNQA
jgi:hypothetical protein